MSDLLHQTFLKGLFDHCKNGPGAAAASIRLLARLKDPARLSKIDDDRIFILIPDLHIVSPEAEKKYRYGFNKREHNSPVARRALFESLMSWITQFRAANGAAVQLYQLGDYVDLWREGQHSKKVSLAQIADDIFDANPFLTKHLDELGSESDWMYYVPGNHDIDLTKTPRFSAAERAYAPKMAGGDRPFLVTHGDLYDRLECQMTDAKQAYFVEEFGPQVETGRYPLRFPAQFAEKLSEGPRILANENDAAAAPDRIQVKFCSKNETCMKAREVHELLSGLPPGGHEQDPARISGEYGVMKVMMEMKNRIENNFTDDVKDAIGVSALPDLQIIAIGHTHFPRIVVVGKDGEPDGFVLMDCGAWIEQVKWPLPGGTSENLDSCQIGVLSGDDARIYQLDPK